MDEVPYLGICRGPLQIVCRSPSTGSWRICWVASTFPLNLHSMHSQWSHHSYEVSLWFREYRTWSTVSTGVLRENHHPFGSLWRRPRYNVAHNSSVVIVEPRTWGLVLWSAIVVTNWMYRLYIPSLSILNGFARLGSYLLFICVCEPPQTMY